MGIKYLSLLSKKQMTRLLIHHNSEKIVKTLTQFLYLTILSFFFTGCATIPVSTYDILPEQTTKGYVEFYDSEGNNSALSMMWFVCKYENGVEINPEISSGREILVEGKNPRKGIVRPKRFAEKPGLHTYVVNLGPKKEKISVEVVEGMITPVKVVIICANPKYSFLNLKGKSFDLELQLSIDTPIPCKE